MRRLPSGGAEGWLSLGKTWAVEILQALSEQTVVVLAAQAASIVPPRLAQQLAALRDPVSSTYYARKISHGKRHNQALIALARQRCDVLFAMLSDGTFYTPPRPEISLTTT